MNNRVARVDTILPRGGGPDAQSPVLVPRGSRVGYHVWAMHRDPRIWGPDAHEFKPQRWDDPALRPGWGYLPFNGGPRVCLGRQLALRIVGYITVRMCQEFEEVASVPRTLDARVDGRRGEGDGGMDGQAGEKTSLDGIWVEDVGLTVGNALGCWVNLKAVGASPTESDVSA